MKIRKTSETAERKPVALIGAGGEVLYLVGPEGRIYKLTGDGVSFCAQISKENSFDDMCAEPCRTPVYKGDTIELKF